MGQDEVGEVGKNKTCRISEALLRSLNFIPSAMGSLGRVLVRVVTFDYLKRIR